MEKAIIGRRVMSDRSDNLFSRLSGSEDNSRSIEWFIKVGRNVSRIAVLSMSPNPNCRYQTPVYCSMVSSRKDGTFKREGNLQFPVEPKEQNNGDCLIVRQAQKGFWPYHRWRNTE
jgi:hypothetical protein